MRTGAAVGDPRLSAPLGHSTHAPWGEFGIRLTPNQLAALDLMGGLQPHTVKRDGGDVVIDWRLRLSGEEWELLVDLALVRPCVYAGWETNSHIARGDYGCVVLGRG